MADEGKKAVLKALRITLCTSICALSLNQIAHTMEDPVALDRFIRATLNTVQNTVVYPFDVEKARGSVGSIIGNMVKCASDLRDSLPKDVQIERLKDWDSQWQMKKEKNKRACNIDSQLLYSKKVRSEQARRAVPVEDRHEEEAPPGYLDSTLRNSECSLSIGIPFDAINFVETIGKGSFGECAKVEIQGISFFPRGNFYAAKKYFGTPDLKLKSFEKEVGVDIMHNGIVRSIGHTRSPPWIAIYPYFNGGSLHSMLTSLPYEKGSYCKVIGKLMGNGVRIVRGTDRLLGEVDRCRIRAFCNCAPSVIHALVQAVGCAHSKGIVHCDLHPNNIVFDFTQDYQPRVGVIDWGLAFRVGYEKRVSQTPTRKELDLRPWLAPELGGTANPDVYTTAVDVYALAWMILQICKFCEEFSSEHPEWESSEQASQVQHIALIMKADYFTFNERKTLDELNKKLHRMRLEPIKCLRPLMEMMPAFY